METTPKKWPGDWNGNWATNYLQRSDLWQAGPVGLLWDNQRGVWTCHGFLRGTLMVVIPAGGRGGFICAGVAGTLTVYNEFSTAFGSTTQALAAHCYYDPYTNKYYVSAVDCPAR